MTTTAAKATTLQEFLKLPETKPASEYIKGEIIQKPMPRGSIVGCSSAMLSTLSQKVGRLPMRSQSCAVASVHAQLCQMWQCSSGHGQFDADGEAPNDFLMHPDWMIEILSPEQSSNR